MLQFIIESNDFLSQDIKAFYHADYLGGGQWKVPGTIENIICTLKNDITPYSINVLQKTTQRLESILETDLSQIPNLIGKSSLTVCVIPRAKVNYNANQLLFKSTLSNVADRLDRFHNGTNYIVRHTDTKTTHLSRGISSGGNGNAPYIGITKDTCSISDNIWGKDILLVDDLYTKTINIDEDAIQALLNKGAKSVVFYAVGKTISRIANLSSH
jgi:hypothetical protein